MSRLLRLRVRLSRASRMVTLVQVTAQPLSTS
jgi:hypothetical protein